MAIQGVQHGIRGRGSYDVEIKLHGEWFKFSYLVNHANQDIALGAAIAQEEFANDYKDALIENIENGGVKFHYDNRSERYLYWKAKLGGSGPTFNWSGALVDNIETYPSRSGRYSVGIKSNVKRGNYGDGDWNRLTISEYANVLEHGAYSRGVPARPIFSDTFRETMGGLKGLKKYLETALIANFAKNGITLSKL